MRLFCTMVLAVAQPASAVDQASLEAAIVFNMLRFTEWPSEAAPTAGGALTLCIETGTSSQAALKALQGQSIRNARLEIRELAGSVPPARCHALFLGGAGSLPSIALRRRAVEGPVLVIGDELAGTADAVGVRLAVEGGRVVFDVDLSAMRRAGLQISSQVLRLARRVHE